MLVTSLLGHKGQFLIEDDCGNIMFESYDTYMAGDPTTVYRFNDGSAIRVENPGQVVYAGYIQVIN